MFGADVTYTFLHENNLRMLVRSHECVPLYSLRPRYDRYIHH